MPQWNLPNAERAVGPSEESSKDFWYENSQEILQRQLKLDQLNKNIAKNMIFFIGDGMSTPTLMVSVERYFKKKKNNNGKFCCDAELFVKSYAVSLRMFS